MNPERLNDMLARYGEVCEQKTAAQILNVNPRTIHRMIKEGRLRGVGHRVDVRSIAEYIENPDQINFMCSARRRHSGTAQVSRDDFLNAARRGHWNSRTGA